jgi:hypothetical protein
MWMLLVVLLLLLLVLLYMPLRALVWVLLILVMLQQLMLVLLMLRCVLLQALVWVLLVMMTLLLLHAQVPAASKSSMGAVHVTCTTGGGCRVLLVRYTRAGLRKGVWGEGRSRAADICTAPQPTTTPLPTPFCNPLDPPGTIAAVASPACTTAAAAGGPT